MDFKEVQVLVQAEVSEARKKIVEDVLKDLREIDRRVQERLTLLELDLRWHSHPPQS
jgi:uncharacterized sporulation protein YeaH/YhbH (DUF444 family)